MTTRFQKVTRLSGFDRDIKKLKRRYRTLEDDLGTLIDTLLFAYHKLPIEVDGVWRIDDLGDIRLPVYKVKKFACQSLKGKGVRTGLRLIYAFDADKDSIELIEIYIKSDQKTEDRARIKKNYGLSG
jgi:mRNA-degrading endonuclease YafQ of YafQ-DinJ toxin-antitoxin module